jgi:6,7-dimethyl-8-ribityllumazine synthase
MATENKNLSHHDLNDLPDCSGLRVGVVFSEWNEEITHALRDGAIKVLKSQDLSDHNIVVKSVPGSFELPLGAQFLCEHDTVDAVVCVGSVIRGETSHFDYVCQGVAHGIKDVSLKYNKPVIFGVLTDNNIEQSRARAGGKHGNKGVEAAVAALKMVALQMDLSQSNY